MKIATVVAAFAGVAAAYYDNVTYVTETVTALTTYCPGPTKVTHGGKTYTITEVRRRDGPIWTGAWATGIWQRTRDSRTSLETFRRLSRGWKSWDSNCLTLLFGDGLVRLMAMTLT